jgi:ferric-dicitrate binding protein FerR (iron transport regulator)
MDRRIRSQTNASLSKQAVEWFIRLRDDDLTRAERSAFASWLKESSMNVLEMMTIERIYASLLRKKLDELEYRARNSARRLN